MPHSTPASLMQEAEISELVDELGNRIYDSTAIEEHEVIILLSVVKEMAKHMQRSEFDLAVKKALADAEERGLYDPDFSANEE